MYLTTSFTFIILYSTFLHRLWFGPSKSSVKTAQDTEIAYNASCLPLTFIK